MLDISTTVGTAGAKTIGVKRISPRASRKKFGRYWHPLGCRAIELGKQPQEGVMHTVAYGYEKYTSSRTAARSH